MNSFKPYSKYIDIVQRTNNIFDIWFFEQGMKEKQAIRAKRMINNICLSSQTKQIIEFLKTHNGPADLLEAFSIRQEIEKNVFDPNSEITEASSRIEELEKHFVNAA